MNNTVKIPHVGDVEVTTLQNLFEVIYNEIRTYEQLSDMVSSLHPHLNPHHPTPVNRDLANLLFEFEAKGKGIEGTCHKSVFLTLYRFFKDGSVLDRSKLP